MIQLDCVWSSYWMWRPTGFISQYILQHGKSLQLRGTLTTLYDRFIKWKCAFESVLISFHNLFVDFQPGYIRYTRIFRILAQWVIRRLNGSYWNPICSLQAMICGSFFLTFWNDEFVSHKNWGLRLHIRSFLLNKSAWTSERMSME
jgi:hypothetical protein